MIATSQTCNVIVGLVGRWHKGRLSELHRNAYEQHLLFCPPCLVQHDKARLAFDALRTVATESPSADLVRRLTERLTAPDGR